MSDEKDFKNPTNVQQKFNQPQNNYMPDPMGFYDPRMFYPTFNPYQQPQQHQIPYNTTNVNVQCAKCGELQNEVKNMSMQITLMSKSIELLNEQIKLLDMKMSITKMKDNDTNNINNTNNTNKNNNKKNNAQNNKNFRTNNNNNKHNNKNNNNNIETVMFPPFMNHTDQKNKINPIDPTVIIQIDDIKPPGQNAAKSPDQVNPFALLGSIFSFMDNIEKKKKQEDEQIQNKDTEEAEDISEYNSEEEFEELEIEIKTIDDLIALGKEYEHIKVAEDKIKEEKAKEEEKAKQTEVESKPNVFMEQNESESNIPRPSRINGRNIIKGVLTRDGKIKFLDQKVNGLQQTTNKAAVTETAPTPATLPVKIEKKSYIINGKKYSINLEVLYKLVKPLSKLKAMIGLDNVKNAIVDMILYYLQQFETKNNSMLHTVIEGPPGVGKTQLGKILAEVYAGLGVIPSNKFKLVKRSDLVGEYLGHTAPKTQKVFDDADGGVLFIDEAYSLGNEEKRDSFSKECIDVINQNLSENKNVICIIAGYPDELDKCFFSYNPGLKRRFPFKFTIDGYKGDELRDIFIKKVGDVKWKINEELNVKDLTDFFNKNKEQFQYFGGDIENFLLNCKFAHSRRVFGKHPKNKRKLNKTDLEIGFDRFVSNKKKNKDIPPHLQHMYS